MSIFKKIWQYITGTTPTTKVIIISLGENGNIENASLDEGQKVAIPAIRIIDFPIEKEEFELNEKTIDWEEFPLWRKQQIDTGVLKLQWNQIKGYLV